MNGIDPFSESDSDGERLAKPFSLEYATLDADGLPEVLPLVDAAIDRGDSARRIARLFPKRQQMPRYVAKLFRRRFNASSAEPQCIICEANSEMLATVRWSYEAARSFIDFRMSDRAVRETLLTVHPLCVNCLNQWNARVGWAVRARRWSAYVGFVAFVPMLLGSIFSRVTSQRSDWPLKTGVAMSLAAILFGSVGTLAFRRGTPPKLKRCVPRWMKCDGCVELARRDDRIAGQHS